MEDEQPRRSKPDVRISPDLATLSRAMAPAVADLIRQRTAAGKLFSLVLSGGSTPRALYQLLAAEFRDRIDWPKVHVFWGDERYVPLDDPRSNYRMAEESLLSRVPLPRENIHPIPTDFPEPEEAARRYEKTLRDYFSSDWPHFDLVLLGLGEEGHTASLFPGAAALGEQRRWVVAVSAPAEPRLRLTLTLPALSHANHVYFLTTGEKKAPALRDVLAAFRHVRNETLSAASNRVILPAAMIQPEGGEIVWWVDQSAAALLLHTDISD